MNNISQQYLSQVDLLLKCLPHVASCENFALKGGTAINFFLLDMPRLSVDIDVTFLPIKAREESLQEIELSLIKIADSIKRAIPQTLIEYTREKKRNSIIKLLIKQNDTFVKIEPNLILRGTVFPVTLNTLSKKIEERFGKAITVSTLSREDLFGGKICAALDRQNPRDLFDIKQLFEHEGLTANVRKAFVIYLASHNRPMHELLNPTLLNIQPLFENEFIGMTEEPVTCDELDVVRKTLISCINSDLSNDERLFLLSLKKGEPQWSYIDVEGIENLPAIQWKVANINKMERAKHAKAVESLQRILGL